MSQTDVSFEALQQALQSMYPGVAPGKIDLRKKDRTLLLRLPTDIAAFAVFNGHLQEQFAEAYGEFKRFYRDNHQEWDKLTLSFVVCRSTEHSEDDRFYAALEHDPLFCRKYVIRAYNDAAHQRQELLRLPFLPLPDGGTGGLQRPQSAQDLLQSAGISASLARNLIETGHRSPERIAADLQEGKESFPEAIGKPGARPVLLSSPRAYSKLVSATLEGFRAYRRSQEFDLNASVVVLYGPNGLGKTSFFDAIEYASTGRIERLCRHQKRNQSEFSRVATHLDKTPGTGSVVLTGRSTNENAIGTDWTLKRATGDWSTAWIDGETASRKEVLSFLTHANWPESQPRQQTFESLFRATHLFGQDDQELLIEFRKGSVIPEEFISEMLALQDYSQGLSKIKGVIAELTTQRSVLEQQRSHLREQLKELTASVSILPETTSETLTPVEELIDACRKRLAESGLVDSPPPDAVSLSSIQEWGEVLAARLRSVEERIGIAMTLRDDLPKYRRVVEEMALSNAKLKSTEQEIENLSNQERELSSLLDANNASLHDAEIQRKQWEQRRAELRSGVEILAEQAGLTKRIEPLRAERETQVTTRNRLDTHLGATEPTLSQLHAAYAEIERAIATQRIEASTLATLLDGLSQFSTDMKALSDADTRLLQTEDRLRGAEKHTTEAEKKAQETKLARESLFPEYERATLQQGDLDQLLDSIQSHLHDSSCPLCGSEFESVEALLARVRLQRSQVANEQDITLRYKALVASESDAADLLRVSMTALSGVKATLADLKRLRDQTQTRVASYRERAYSALKDRNTEISEPILVARCNDMAKDLKALEERAEATDRELKDLEALRASDAVQRSTANHRISQLDREIQGLTDEIAQRVSGIRQIVEREGISDSEMEKAITQLSTSIDEAVVAASNKSRERDDGLVKLEDLRTRIKAEGTRRDECLAQLERHRVAAADIRRKMSSLDLPEIVDVAAVDQVVLRLEQAATVIRSVLEQIRLIVDALKAREMRLQIAEKQDQIDKLQADIEQLETLMANVTKAAAGCSTVEKLLRSERQTSIEKHISAYGPLITNIQQRLRSVYGFGGVQLEARGGEAVVQVEWRNKSVQVTPTDFFSDSQKQILMLSIFLAGGLRQNWSGFAPVLLDDPVTHFDDLNAYGFVELVRGIISSRPNAWQFFISTCEDRLFALMQKKFARVEGGAVFYEFLGMSENGPIVERR